MNLARSHNKVAFLPILALLLAMSPAGAASLPNFSDLVEKASPAVVNISTTQKSTVHSRLPEGMEIPDLPEDSPFGDLFRHFFGEEGGGNPAPATGDGLAGFRLHHFGRRLCVDQLSRGRRRRGDPGSYQ